ncbi:MAG: diacylglycerol kinase family protein [Firmicutes bacterium]|nr:diacylglycerol kinase family protein [Candidatus Fermentithermobacillaceae bacterium]
MAKTGNRVEFAEEVGKGPKLGEGRRTSVGGDTRFFRARSLKASFGYAWEGLSYVWTTQRNMRIHVLIGSLVVSAALLLGLGRVDFLLVVFAITLVLSAEVLNTLAEALVDLLTPDYAPMAKVVKDVAAGGVLLASIFSVITGLAVFVPALTGLFRTAWSDVVADFGRRLPWAVPALITLVLPALIGLFLPAKGGKR